MQFLKDLLAKPYRPQDKEEVENLLAELLRIGKSDDFLAERPGAGFNSQSRHIRTIQIGKRLDQIGGLPLMEYAHRHVKRKIGKQLSSHLEYAWSGIGRWWG